jgi:hypothetical protein
LVANSAYSLVGGRASRADRGDSVRKRTVKVTRPDLDVRTRAGYYVERPRNPLRSTAAEQPQTALDKLFGKALPTGDLPLAVSVAPFARPGTREAVLAVTIGTVRPSSEQVVTEQVRLRTTAYEYEVYRDRGTVNQTVELTARPSAAGERRFDVPARLSVPPGRYEVRVGAESSSGAAGAVFVNTDVPNFAKAKLALSGLVLGHRRRASTGPSDVLADVIPVEPTVRREFVTAEPVQAFVRVYQGGATAPLAATVAARIIDSTDREVFGETVVLAREQFGIARAADYQLNLGRTTLGPGAYLLSIEVKAANNTVRRELRFTVTSATGATTPGPV